MENTLLKTLTACLLFTGAAAAQEPVLENYSIQLGTTTNPSLSAGADVVLRDRFFGGGTARSRIRLVEQSSSSTIDNRPMLLTLDVNRTVRPGEIVFALLVFRVEIRGHGSDGSLVFTRDLPGFTFGDSASGEWYERIPDLPTRLVRLTVTFTGNYE